MDSIYTNFLKHLRTCQGCTGPIEHVNCKFKLPCIVAEKLAQKGRVRDSKELLAYGCKKSCERDVSGV